jgi:hypothetical protein
MIKNRSWHQENEAVLFLEGGSNLFIDDIDIFKDILPVFVNPQFKNAFNKHPMSLAQYLSKRGAFKLLREPGIIKNKNGDTIKIGKMDLFSLTRAYRYHIVKEKEM